MPKIFINEAFEFIFEQNGFCFIGVTDKLLTQMENIEGIRLPQIGESYTKGEIFGFIEAQDKACELFMPVSGNIKEINVKIIENPQIIKTLSIIERWLIKISTDFFDIDKQDLKIIEI